MSYKVGNSDAFVGRSHRGAAVRRCMTKYSEIISRRGEAGQGL